MFDHLPDPAHDVGPSSGARLLRESGRIGGEAGAALAHALGGMCVDSTVDSAHWPLTEALEMLHRPDMRPDPHVDRLVARLSKLSRRVDAAA